jgi:hypothetical protein
MEELRQLWQSEPFQPFLIHMADGRDVPVRQREFLSMGPSRIAVVHQPDESFEIVDVALVTSLEVKPHATARPGNGQSAAG